MGLGFWGVGLGCFGGLQRCKGVQLFRALGLPFFLGFKFLGFVSLRAFRVQSEDLNLSPKP